VFAKRGARTCAGARESAGHGSLRYLCKDRWSPAPAKHSDVKVCWSAIASGSAAHFRRVRTQRIPESNSEECPCREPLRALSRRDRPIEDQAYDYLARSSRYFASVSRFPASRRRTDLFTLDRARARCGLLRPLRLSPSSCGWYFGLSLRNPDRRRRARPSVSSRPPNGSGTCCPPTFLALLVDGVAPNRALLPSGGARAVVPAKVVRQRLFVRGENGLSGTTACMRVALASLQRSDHRRC